ncbi:hypothetical protein [Actinopolymorpha pittospori]|uniref:Uncharacterized protein n=1 Tax=Actinopolymorpha pittospori TaxID=648752 RepID=A0A927N259_9ACTN|nr:hypothetical protein [Actinopolymorpha pittospori]MBE1609578.1 hypothetical protein [Actinopolymorpha pittospori]
MTAYLRIELQAGDLAGDGWPGNDGRRDLTVTGASAATLAVTVAPIAAG